MWDLIGCYIVDFVLNFFDIGHLSREINVTWVALVPKEDDAIDLGKYKPISMVGCLDKIISKILANKLKSVMSNLVLLKRDKFLMAP